VGGLRQSRRQTFHDVHFRGMRHLVEACRARRVRRVVHVSALGASPVSRSAFLRAKYLGEEVVRRSLLDVTVLRPAPIYGPGDDFVVPLARMLGRLPVAPLPGRGRLRLQPIAVGDVARAAAAALARDRTVGEVYDLPGPEVLTLGEIYDRVMLALGRRRPKIGVPYLVLEPIAHLLGAPPISGFTFEHLALLEESVASDPGPAARALGLAPGRLDEAAIRACLEG
jgi:NADH dehydrogenase